MPAHNYGGRQEHDTGHAAGRFVLWAGASVLYGIREHPDQDLAQVILGAWL
jgi:hypothetical protein